MRPIAVLVPLLLPWTTAVHAATDSISGATITKIWHNTENTRGPNGRAWMTLDTRFNLAGGCAYMGAVDAPPNWSLEFYVEHGSFDAMYAQALLAFAQSARVTIQYDDGFGGGTTCRITSIVIEQA